MRVIEIRMIGALRARKSWKSGNTSVECDGADPTARVYLHGNLIAKVHGNCVEFTLAGWPTPTTRSRLNAVLGEFSRGVRVFQHKGASYYTTNVASRDAECVIDSNEWVTVPRNQEQ